MRDIEALKLLGEKLVKSKAFSKVPEESNSKQYVDKAINFLDEVNKLVDKVQLYSEEIRRSLKLLLEEQQLQRGEVKARLKILLDELDRIKGNTGRSERTGGNNKSRNLNASEGSQSTSLTRNSSPTNRPRQDDTQKGNKKPDITKVDVVKEIRDLTELEAKRQDIYLALNEAENVLEKLWNTSNEEKVDVTDLKNLMVKWMQTKDDIEREKREGERRKREEERMEKEREEQEKQEAKRKRRQKEEEDRRKREEEKKKLIENALDEVQENMFEDLISEMMHNIVGEARAKEELVQSAIESLVSLTEDSVIREAIDDAVEESLCSSSIIMEMTEEIVKEEMQRFAETLDPRNWKPIIYKRPGKKPQNMGEDVLCVIFAMDGALHKDDLHVDLRSCSNEEVNLAVSEKLASPLLTIESMKGKLDIPILRLLSCTIDLTQAKVTTVTRKLPIRVFLPYHVSVGKNEDLQGKVAVDDTPWTYTEVDHMSLNSIYEKIDESDARKSSVQLVGVAVKNFSCVNIAATSKTKSQTYIVDGEGRTIFPDADKEIAVVFPDNCFDHPVEVNIEVLKGHEKSMELLRHHHPYCHDVRFASAFVLVECDEISRKPIIIQLNKNKVKGYERGAYMVQGAYRPKQGNWHLIEKDIRDSYVHVQPEWPKLQVSEFETQPGSSNTDNTKVIKEIHCFAHELSSCLLVRQRHENPEIAVINWMRSERVEARLSQLEDLGYTKGPDISPEFCVLDGQILTISTEGNVQFTKEVGKKIRLTFRANIDQARMEVSLVTKDRYQQKDYLEYKGNLIFKLEKDNRKDGSEKSFQGKLILTLPKAVESDAQNKPKPIPICFPHYITALVKFLSMEFCKMDTSFWFDFFTSLTSKKKMVKFQRNVESKYGQMDTQKLYERMLSDWIKSTACYEDKVVDVLHALRTSRIGELSNEVKVFVKIHEDFLGDKGLKEKTKMIGIEWEFLARELGLSSADIDKLKMDYPQTSDLQIYNMLCHWRERTDTISMGCSVMEFFLSTLRRISGYKPELEIKLAQEIQDIKYN